MSRILTMVFQLRVVALTPKPFSTTTLPRSGMEPRYLSGRATPLRCAPPLPCDHSRREVRRRDVGPGGNVDHALARLEIQEL